MSAEFHTKGITDMKSCNALGLIRQARTLLKEEEDTANSRELSMVITKLDEAVRCMPRDMQVKEPTENLAPKKMTLLESLKKHKANDPEGSAWLVTLAKARFEELKHKGWDWQSFYNGWIEGLHASVNALTDNLDFSEGDGK